MKNDKRIRIGIIGAGPAGLTAAETLRDKGYSDVTLLENKIIPAENAAPSGTPDFLTNLAQELFPEITTRF